MRRGGGGGARGENAMDTAVMRVFGRNVDGKKGREERGAREICKKRTAGGGEEEEQEQEE